MIVTSIHGGLGNQMFQYAAGRRAAILSGVPLGIDLTLMKKYKKRSYGLNQFMLSPEVDVIDGELFSKGRGLKRVWRKLTGTYRDRVEKTIAFDPEVLDIRPPARLVGYWQSEKYFQDVADTIRVEFGLSAAMSVKRRAVYEDIVSCDSISVHVRRGDYVSVQKYANIFGTCSIEWYGRAVSIAAEGMTKPVFFVFSDDMRWAKNNLSLPGRVVWVEPVADGRDAEELHLMAACRAHVTANSSFSWWGAWLDPREDSRIVAPSRWFLSEKLDARDIVPERWVRL